MTPSTHQFTLLERVLHGQRAADALPVELQRHGSRRAFVISTASLANSPALHDIVDAMGQACVGVYAAVKAHAPRDSVIAGAAAAREARADVLIAIGGGSVIDATKVMLLAMRHGYSVSAQLDPHAGATWAAATQRPEDHARWLRMIAIPTTFSAAEYTAVGGATDQKTKSKQAFGNQMMMPVAVINDPSLTMTAPLDLLLATGMKAVDHAVERMTSNQANLYSDTVSAVALSLLARGLPMLRRDPANLELRADLQYGVFMSMAGIASGVRSHLAHAIAHSMGSLCDVPHGLTSCVLLPSVLRWTGSAAAAGQRAVCKAMGRDGSDAGGAIAELVASLGLPARLRDVGVRVDQLPLIAERTLYDPLTANSPRRIETAAQIREVLDMAW